MLLRRFATASTSLPPTIRQLLSSLPPAGQAIKVQLSGWIKSVRKQKNVTFAVINDGSCASGLQAVLKSDATPHNLTNGASVRICGNLVQSMGRGQSYELQAEAVDILGECNPEAYPIQKQTLPVEFLRDNAHLRARTDTNAAMLRLRDSVLRMLHSYYEAQDFHYVHTPILTSNDCEGGGETFRVSPASSAPPSKQLPDPSAQAEFFSQPAYLTVSSQLHLEALAASLSRVYTLSPCFRAERSQTNRHLAEFWMLEAEWAFINHVGDICDVVEESLKHVLQCRSEQTLLWKDGDEAKLKSLEDASRPGIPWTRISYTDAVNELQNYHASSRVGFEFEPAWGKALQSEHERWVSERLVGGPVFVTDYPTSLKPFYMRANDDGQTVACFDLLVPSIGELVGGSLREERSPHLVEAIRRHGLKEEEYGWYVDLRKYGSAPHGGYGLGFERLISWMSGIENVRECIAMPRWAKRMLL
ncbi:asparaginyl-tRNA synthetase [Suillus hirtellus]|nr:asparaginyl-tRNA synthetase [Suillus hirtellus]